MKIIQTWTIQKQNPELLNIPNEKLWFSQNMKFNLKKEFFNSLILDKFQIKTIIFLDMDKIEPFFPELPGSWKRHT